MGRAIPDPDKRFERFTGNLGESTLASAIAAYQRAVDLGDQKGDDICQKLWPKHRKVHVCVVRV